MAFNDFACLPYLDKDERAASEDLRRNLPAFAARQCGYQLVLGANDQATAEYASRARKAHDPLPMGIPHPSPHEGRADSRTRSDDAAGGPANAGEQDGLLIEGQRPIFGEKLRFFQTQPFKSAEAYSQANISQVPEVDYFPPKAVPATTPQYANGGRTVRNSLAGASERGEAFGGRRGGGSTAQGSHCSRRG